MIAQLIILLIVAGAVIYFVLKCSVTTAVASVFCSLFAAITAMAYYETVAGLLAGQGLVGPVWSAVTLLVLYIVVAVILRVLASFVVGSEIDLGPLGKNVAVPALGVLQGLILAGIATIAFDIHPAVSFLSYSRYGERINPATPEKLMLNADGLFSGLFSWVSQGSLRSRRSFGVYHADYLNKLHLARVGDVYPMAGSEAIQIPRKGVRTRDFDGTSYVVVRLQLKGSTIKDDGAADPQRRIQFVPAQVRLLCKPTQQEPDTTGTARVVYPAGFVSRTGELIKKELGDVLELQKDAKPAEQILWPPQRGSGLHCDVAFNMPQGLRPILLQFKFGASVQVPVVQASTPELEDELEGRGQADSSS